MIRPTWRLVSKDANRLAFNAQQSRYSSTSSGTEETDLRAARSWLKAYTAETIPKSIGELSFSRSSGPGGQNVNKVNSKATLRIPFGPLRDIVPVALHDHLKTSSYYARNTDSLVITASESRKQGDNVTNCYRKLSALISEAGAQAVPGETSEEQKSRVKRLQAADNEHRMQAKKMHSNKKSSRKGGWD